VPEDGAEIGGEWQDAGGLRRVTYSHRGECMSCARLEACQLKVTQSPHENTKFGPHSVFQSFTIRLPISAVVSTIRCASELNTYNGNTYNSPSVKWPTFIAGLLA
jgi:hypothetical protein